MRSSTLRAVRASVNGELRGVVGGTGLLDGKGVDALGGDWGRGPVEGEASYTGCVGVSWMAGRLQPRMDRMRIDLPTTVEMYWRFAGSPFSRVISTGYKIHISRRLRHAKGRCWLRLHWAKRTYSVIARPGELERSTSSDTSIVAVCECYRLSKYREEKDSRYNEQTG